MMHYIENKRTDPYFNLALEQFVFDHLDREQGVFMLWQNDNSIIVGKHQNTSEEINPAFVKEKNITVARRLSGGGAVYHDLGNLNYTFIAAADRANQIDFSLFCEPIRKALVSLGVPVEISGRNDMQVEGKKFSGNAQYIKGGRVMHHGTILFDSDLEILSQALKPGSGKIESKSIKSVRSRVTNIRPYLKTKLTTREFWNHLKGYMASAFDLREFALTPEHIGSAEELREKVYAQWSWNYGNSPPFTARKARRFENSGRIEALLDMRPGGEIGGVTFYGDFFGNRDPGELGSLMTGHRLEYNELATLLNDVEISQYFHALDREGFLSLLLE